jgi:hypothetical protein
MGCACLNAKNPPPLVYLIEYQQGKKIRLFFDIPLFSPKPYRLPLREFILQVDNQLVASTLCVLHTAIRNTLHFSEILQVISQRFPLRAKDAQRCRKKTSTCGDARRYRREAAPDRNHLPTT